MLPKKNSEDKKIQTIFQKLQDGSTLEAIYKKDKHKTVFIHHKDDHIEEKDTYHDPDSSMEYQPIPAKYQDDGVVYLPTSVGKFQSAADAIAKIKSFISHYLDVNSQDLHVISSYVMMTWIYECFEKIPLLRFIGTYGTGKSRALSLLRVISYHSINLGTSQTSTNIYRALRRFGGGTIFMDEANFKSTTREDEITKILLAGYEKNKPVSRINPNTNEPEYFPTFSPKVLANHTLYDDIALESRTITIKMQLSTNPNIPLTLPDQQNWPEAEEIQAMLLDYRLKTLMNGISITNYQELRQFEARTAEIYTPLAALSGLEIVPMEILTSAKDHERELTIMTDYSPETLIARTALEIIENGTKIIYTSELASKVEQVAKFPISPRTVNTFLRQHGATSKKYGKGYRLDLSGVDTETLTNRYCAHE
jgi:hypothetical protein